MTKLSGARGIGKHQLKNGAKKAMHPREDRGAHAAESLSSETTSVRTRVATITGVGDKYAAFVHHQFLR